MNMHQQIGLIACAALMLGGCAGIESRTHPAYAPMEPIVYTNPTEGDTAGSLYSQQRGLSLFADTRARAVGDIISIVLTESTQASKNAGTAVARDAGIDVSQPTIFGRSNPDFSVDGRKGLTLEQSIASASEFSGNGSTNQSNSLSGAYCSPSGPGSA
jgi:flagellar L-ring protein precursor FlgH